MSNIYAKAKKIAEDSAAQKRLEEQEKDFIIKNPYLAGKQKTLDIYLGLAQNVDTWRMAFMSVLALLAVCVVLLIVTAQQSSRIVPYVVEVDAMGQTYPVAPAGKSDVTERIISSQLGQFVQNSRRRVLDKTAQLYFVRQSYRCVADGSEAYRKLNAYYRNNIPINATEEVAVTIHNIMPLSETSYNVEWDEASDGGSSGTVVKRYKGYFEVAVSPPEDMKHVISNPLGIFIKNYAITEVI